MQKPNPLDFSCPNDNYIWIKRQLPAKSAFVLLQNKGSRRNLGCASGFQNDEFMFISITGSGQQWSHCTHFRAEQKEVCSLYHHTQDCHRDEYLSPTTSSIIFLFSFRRNLSLGCTRSIQWERNSCPLINAQKVRKLVQTKGKNSSTIIYCGLSGRESAECFACLHWVCWAFIPLSFDISFLMEKNKKSPHTFCHLGNFLVENPPSTCGCPTPTFHTKLSAIQETQKKGGKSVPGTCQTRPLRVQVHMPENKTSTHKPHFE